MFLSPVDKKGFENTTVFLFARREVRAGAVAEAAGVIFFSRIEAKDPKERRATFFLGTSTHRRMIGVQSATKRGATWRHGRAGPSSGFWC